MIYRGRRLVHAYDGRKVLGPCSFSVAEGACFAVVGPNGSGKTTLAEILVGLLEPTAGELWLCGERVRLPLARSLRRSVGYVAQQPFALPGAVADNLLLAARTHARGAAAVELVRDMTNMLEISDLLDRPERKLSVGQLRMVSMARALVRRAPILVLDEPFAFVDPRYAGAIERALARHRADGGTIVMTSPRASDVSGWATDVLDLGAAAAPRPVSRLRRGG